jgi:tubulin polyglutamylase TTLL4
LVAQVPRRKDTDEIKPGLIQRYIANPLLLNGSKCDLRLYVVATCYNPLRLYIYPEGLVRIR